MDETTLHAVVYLLTHLVYVATDYMTADMALDKQTCLRSAFIQWARTQITERLFNSEWEVHAKSNFEVIVESADFLVALDVELPDELQRAFREVNDQTVEGWLDDY